MWYSRYTEGGGDTHDCQKEADMIVESDNRCEFCGKKMLTQIYKESYGEYNMFDFCPDCDGRPGGIAYLKVASKPPCFSYGDISHTVFHVVKGSQFCSKFASDGVQ